MNKYKIEIKWALIFVGMMLIWMLFEKMAGLHSTHIDKHPIFTNFIAIPAVLIFVLALRDKKKNFYNGQMNYKQGFITGLVMTLIVTLFTPLIQYITSTIITPEYFPNAIKYAVSNGKLSQGEAEKYFSLKNYMTMAPAGSIVMGLITTAIVALFVRSKK